MAKAGVTYSALSSQRLGLAMAESYRLLYHSGKTSRYVKSSNQTSTSLSGEFLEIIGS